MDARLGPAGEDGIRVAAPDQLGGLPDRVRPGRTRRDGRVVRPAEAERDRKLSARSVDEHARNEGWGDAGRAACPQHLGLLHDPQEAADRRAEQNPNAAGIVGPVEPGVVHGLLGSAEREEHEPVELPDLFRRGEAARVEILDLRTDPDRLLARVVRADEVDPASPLDGGVPARRGVVSDRRHRAEPRDRYPPHSTNLDGAEPSRLRCAFLSRS